MMSYPDMVDTVVEVLRNTLTIKCNYKLTLKQRCVIVSRNAQNHSEYSVNEAARD